MDIHNGYELLSPSLTIRIRDQDEIPKTIGGSPTLPVGADGGGNLFLLTLRPPHEVWKWNHETGAATNGTLPLAHPSLTPVSFGFVAFLERVLEDWEHFVADDRQWPFLAG